MGDDGHAELPIFELGLAIVPGEHVPLHIFEERYRQMIAHCLEAEEPFGIVLRDAEPVRSIGCTARVIDVLERYEDGRLDVVVAGEAPFRVLNRFEAPAWPAAGVEWIEPEIPPEPPTEELRRARVAFGELLEAVGAQPERAEAATDAFAIAAQIEMPPARKQALLEAPDETSRLIALEATLQRLLAAVERSRQLGERAKSNGHGPGRIGPSR